MNERHGAGRINTTRCIINRKITVYHGSILSWLLSRLCCINQDVFWRMSEWQCLMSVWCPEISPHDNLGYVTELSLPHPRHKVSFSVSGLASWVMNIIIFAFRQHVTFLVFHYGIFPELVNSWKIYGDFLSMWVLSDIFMSRQPGFFVCFFLLRDTSFAFRFSQCELASWLEWKHSYYGADEAF